MTGSDMTTVVAGTGHRPDKLWLGDYSGYHPLNPLRAWVKAQTRSKLQQLQPAYVISGMAPGFDQDLAEVCIDLGLPFTAAVPFTGQELRWPPDAQQHYHRILARAREVVIVTEGSYERWKMLARNEWMIDRCTDVIACFDGSSGGTAHTVNYANRVQRPIHRIDPNDLRRLLAAGAVTA